MMHPLLIVGAGGHAAVIVDALLAAGEQVVGFTDVDPRRLGSMLCGRPILGDDSVLEERDRGTLLLVNGIGGVGDTSLRRTVQVRLEARGWRFASVRHPAAVVSLHAHVGASAQVLAASVVQIGATIGEGCIINTAAVVEHDVSLSKWVHVAPGALLCGGVAVGEGSHIGAGAVVREGINLGAGTLVGAGAVVVDDFEGGGTLVGVPARVARHR